MSNKQKEGGMANEKVILQLMEEINKSEDKEAFYNYISEVAERCDKLCKKGEVLRTLTEYNYLFENLKKWFSINW